MNKKQEGLGRGKGAIEFHTVPNKKVGVTQNL